MTSCELTNMLVHEHNRIMKNEIVCIVHGVGSGIVKNEIHKYLKNNKLIEDYKLFYNNSGCTIVKIKY